MFRQRFRALPLCIGALALFLASAYHAAGDPIQLKLKFTVGEKTTQRFTVDSEVSQSVSGQNMTQQQQQVTELTREVLAVDGDGIATLAMVWDSVKSKQTTPMGVIEYDSTNPDKQDAPMAKLLGAQVGHKLTMKITPAGEVTELEGAEELVQKMIDGMGPEMAAAKEMLQEQLKGQFGAKALKSMFSQASTMLPDKPVDVGDSWEKTMNMNQMIPMEISSTYTVASREDGIMNLDVKGEITTGEGAMKMGPMEALYDLKGAQTGKTKLDEATGDTIASTMEQKLKGTISLQGGPEPMQVPMEITTKIRIETLE